MSQLNNTYEGDEDMKITIALQNAKIHENAQSSKTNSLSTCLKKFLENHTSKTDTKDLIKQMPIALPLESTN